MSRTPLWILLPLALACESPPAPPAPPAERLPPIELAARCPPGAKLVNTDAKPPEKFFLADLELDEGCEIALEEDECVLAIFRDCTWKPDGVEQGSPGAERQWIGTLTDDGGHRGTIEIKPQYGAPPSTTQPVSCKGDVDDTTSKTASSHLGCGTNHRGLFLEKKNPALLPAYVTSIQDVLVLGDVVDPNILNVVSIASVGTGTAAELWTALSVSGQAGGVFSWKPGESAVHQIAAIPNAFELVVGGAGVLVSVRKDNYTTTGLRLIDPVSHEILASALIDGNIGAIGADPHSNAYFVGYSDGQAQGIGAVDRLELQGGNLVRVAHATIGPVVVSKVQTVVTATGAVTVVVGANEPHVEGEHSRGFLKAFDASLNERWHNPDGPTWARFQVVDLVPIPGTNKVGLIGYDSRRYYEFDVRTGALDDPIPVPFFDAVTAGIYDAQGDRVFLLGRFGHLSILDRRIGRVLQPDYWPEQDVPGHVFDFNDGQYDPGTGLLYLTDPEHGSIVRLKPRPPP
ncbi:MAG: hypothetical protein U1E65_01420 [Myxococcota bacterium]